MNTKFLGVLVIFALFSVFGCSNLSLDDKNKGNLSDVQSSTGAAMQIKRKTQPIYYVSQINGNDSNPGTSTQPFKSISAAIKKVLNGDKPYDYNGPGAILHVLSGTYSKATSGETYAPIEVPANVHLIGTISTHGGYDKGAVTIIKDTEGQPSGEIANISNFQTCVLLHTDAEISGFQIPVRARYFANGALIPTCAVASLDENVQITYNRLYNIEFINNPIGANLLDYGIVIGSGNSGSVVNNNIEGFYYGIWTSPRFGNNGILGNTTFSYNTMKNNCIGTVIQLVYTTKSDCMPDFGRSGYSPGGNKFVSNVGYEMVLTSSEVGVDIYAENNYWTQVITGVPQNIYNITPAFEILHTGGAQQI